MTDFIDSSETYSVHFKGEISPNFPVPIAKANCSRLLKIEGEKLERMFSGRSIILRKGATLAQARYFADVFAQNGLIVYVELEVAETEDESLSLEPLVKFERTRWVPKEKRSTYDDSKNFSWKTTVNNMKFLDYCVDGRVGNLSYINFMLSIWLGFLMFLALVFFMNQSLSDIRTPTAFLLCFGLIVYACSFFQSVLRLHDLNFSGMWAMVPFCTIALAALIPGYGFLSVFAWVFNVLYFIALAPPLGSEEDNIYGDPPPPQSRTDYVPDVADRHYSLLSDGRSGDESEQIFDEEASSKMLNAFFRIRTIPKEYAERIERSNARLFIDRFIQGRIGQFGYIVESLTIWLAFISFALLAKAITGYSEPMPITLKIFVLCVGFFLYIYTFYLNIIRLHDLNFSGIWAFIAFLAIVLTSFLGSLSSMLAYSAQLNLFAIFVNLATLAILCAFPTMEEENNYGFPEISLYLKTEKTRKRAIIVPSVCGLVTLILLIVNVSIR